MTTTPCTHLEEFLEQQADGPLLASTMAHLDACTVCQALWHDLSVIRDVGRELGADEPAPPERVWVSLRMQMESEGLIRAIAPVTPVKAEVKVPAKIEVETESGWFGSWIGALARPALAGAYLSILLVGAALIAYVHYQPAQTVSAASVPGRFTPTAPVSASLGRTLEGDMERVMATLPQRDPALATSLRENLGIVDNLIAVCEKSVREQPSNNAAREYLYDAYQQKAVLLATAMDSTLEDK